MSTTSTSTRVNLWAGAAALIVMALAFLMFSGTSDGVDVSASDTNVASTSTVVAVDDTAVEDTAVAGTAVAGTAQAETTVVESVDTLAQFSNLPTISSDELPIEAIETLLLIVDGGPYPYRQDDGTFQNREGILPDRAREHYREYTVDTPGSPDRGARRVVTGADGERYYTDDHYDSFREIVG